MGKWYILQTLTGAQQVDQAFAREEAAEEMKGCIQEKGFSVVVVTKKLMRKALQPKKGENVLKGIYVGLV